MKYDNHVIKLEGNYTNKHRGFYCAFHYKVNTVCSNTILRYAMLITTSNDL